MREYERFNTVAANAYVKPTGILSGTVKIAAKE